MTAVILKVWNEEALIKLCIEQFKSTNITHLYLFDDGSTDDTIEVAKSLSLPFELEIINVANPHLDYFPDSSQRNEPSLLNQMIDRASSHDWVIHIDADEVCSDELLQFINTLQDAPPNLIGIKVPYLHLVNDLSTYIMRLPNFPYDMSPGYNTRIFRPTMWRFPDTQSLDSSIQPIADGLVGLATYPIIHIHYLDVRRRGNRGATSITDDGSKQMAYRQPGCEYREVSKGVIPENLIKWYNERTIEW